MKIGILIFSFIPKIGGTQTFTYNLAKRLSERGHIVGVYLPTKNYFQYRSYSNNDKFKTYPIFIKEKSMINCCPFIVSLILWLYQIYHHYDLWQIIGAYPAGYYAASLLSKKVPLILRTHGEDIQKDTSINYGLRLNKRIEKRIISVLKKVNYVVALTKTVSECYTELQCEKDKIIEIPNGVDLSRFNKSIEKNIVKQKYNIPKKSIFILTIGRYHVKKGYEVIPEAAEYLKKKGYNFFWLIVGKNTKNLISLIRKFKLNDVLSVREEISDACNKNDSKNLDFPSNELIELYKAADIFAAPSLIETFGMVLIEAMAARLPIIATNAPGCKDVIIDGYNGIQAKRGDVLDFARKLESLINDQNLRNYLTKNAQESVKRYDWNNIVSEYEKVYKSVLTHEN